MPVIHPGIHSSWHSFILPVIHPASHLSGCPAPRSRCIYPGIHAAPRCLPPRPPPAHAQPCRRPAGPRPPSRRARAHALGVPPCTEGTRAAHTHTHARTHARSAEGWGTGASARRRTHAARPARVGLTARADTCGVRRQRDRAGTCGALMPPGPHASARGMSAGGVPHTWRPRAAPPRRPARGRPPPPFPSPSPPRKGGREGGRE